MAAPPGFYAAGKAPAPFSQTVLTTGISSDIVKIEHKFYSVQKDDYIKKQERDA